MAQEEREVVERLRASREAARIEALPPSERAKIRGYAAGQEWARQHAGAPELERLKAIKSGFNPGKWVPAFVDARDSRDRLGNLKCATSMHARLYGIDEDPETSAGFWRNWLTEEESQNSFAIMGFADGAVDVWDDVVRQLDLESTDQQP